MQPSSSTTQRRIIAGLGNPGREYIRSRHNVGFQVIDRLAAKHGLRFSKMMSRAIIATGEINGIKVVLVKPQTFMNESGLSVGPIVKYYKADFRDLLVIYDDLDLPVAQVRMRRFGGSGGHNGMKSIIARVGSDDFPRLRIGIGRPPGRMDPMDYVLHSFSDADLELMDEAYERAVQGIERWLVDDIDRVMNVVNAAEDQNKGEGREPTVV